MNCYKCGCLLSEKDFCTGCGADVSRYKKIIYMSNQFYNEGLEKAQVRDLSGAVDSLRQSLKMNKMNTMARNLLGLCYFELGRTVEALSEWVISKNYQNDKNIADDYLEVLQSNPALLDTINTTVKKYNQCIVYCNQESYDVAKIQLKKIVNINPRLLDARILLALLLIKDEEWKAARIELEACKKVDIGNVMVNRYLKEVNDVLDFEATKAQVRKKKDNHEAVSYKSGNDIVIQPNNPKESPVLNNILNICVGLLIGLVIGWFLIGPLRVRMSKDKLGEEIESVRKENEEKATTINELTRDMESLRTEKEALADVVDSYEGQTGYKESYRNLLLGVVEYNKGSAMDKTAIAGYLEAVSPDLVGEDGEEAFIYVYDMLRMAVGDSVAQGYYETGYEAYRIQDYATAIEYLTKAVYYDPENSEALYALANAYKENQDFAKAKDTYLQVIEKFPDTEKASKAQSYIDEIDSNN